MKRSAGLVGMPVAAMFGAWLVPGQQPAARVDQEALKNAAKKLRRVDHYGRDQAETHFRPLLTIDPSCAVGIEARLRRAA